MCRGNWASLEVWNIGLDIRCLAEIQICLIDCFLLLDRLDR